MFSRSYAHSPIKEIFPNIFFVTGVNQYVDNNGEQQHSRNMIIVRENNKLSLINTVQLTEAGLVELDHLGEVENVIRIGAFHGRDDGFYLDRYQAKLWALQGMKQADNRMIELTINGPKPFPNCSVFIFREAKEAEGILHINQEDGILITCDSIKNWLKADKFFSKKTALSYEKAGFFGQATVSKIWREHCQVQLADFMQLDQFAFKHLLSAHGKPLLNCDKRQLLENIKIQYGQCG
jgi:hypothetical protein